VLAPLLGEKVSASTISRIANDLDKEVKLYHDRKVEDRYRFVFRRGGLQEQRNGEATERFYCAPLGSRWREGQEMIDFYPPPVNRKPAVKRSCDIFTKEGLRGRPCPLMATDGGTGLHAALEIVYPKILLQRCWAHKTRNVLEVKKAVQPAVKKALNRISHARNHREATEAYWRLVSRWRNSYPKAVACLDKISASC
jgi:transposase-like protein